MEFDPETLFPYLSMSLPLHASHDAMDVATYSKGHWTKGSPLISSFQSLRL